MTRIVKSVEVAGHTLTFETGHIAKQADGAVFATHGETGVLATACCSGTPRPGINFFPLSCDYIEKYYSAGRIPGSYFRREGRPSEREVLVSRMIDRPARPLFPEGFMAETQVIATVMSYDQENASDVLGMNAAYAAIAISNIPWAGPVAAVRVGRIDGELVAFPTVEQRAESDLDLVAAVGPKGLVMVEGGAKLVSEEVMVDALIFAGETAQPIIQAMRELAAEVGNEKFVFEAPEPDADLVAACREAFFDKIAAASQIPDKMERYAAVDAVKAEAVTALSDRFPDQAGAIKSIVGGFKSEACRKQIVSERKRLDGRGLDDVRAIDIELGVLPRSHGSAVFQRGETQGIIAVTLGVGKDNQRIETLDGMTERNFMLHYNFPPYCVGEVGRMGGTKRREIGHGALARRGLLPVIPDFEMFPYVLRSVSEITESNGSSSMATVCGTSLAMMDAGVPVSEAVAGIAMGLIKEGGEVRVLSDILGDEDHFGDMDFKVVGGASGISALQMDIKIDGLSREVLQTALEQARRGRLHILDEMKKAIAAPRPELPKTAPRIFTILINPDKIRDLIGPGGKHIRAITSETGASIDVSDDGSVKVAAVDEAVAQKAIELVKAYTSEPEVGQDYNATVVRIADFGAFVQLAPGQDALLHISELADRRIAKVTDVVNLGDEILVRVVNVDRSGKVRVSHREAINAQRRANGEEVPEREERRERSDRGGDGEGGDRKRRRRRRRRRDGEGGGDSGGGGGDNGGDDRASDDDD